jgi:predicted Zn-dependent peptidase
VSVRVTSLPSGLAVVTETTPHLRTAAIGVFVAAGSRYERASEHGLSHFIEHMAFKGTRRRSAREIAEAIENVGGDLNAETGVERTSYFARVLGGDVALALDVIGDLLTESAFDPHELEREKNVILQEIGSVEDTPDDLVFDLLTATAWPDQPIGRPILGTRERVEAFDRAAIDDYLTRRYSAGGTIVAAAGAVSHDHILELVHSRLERLPVAPAPAEEGASAYRGGETRIRRRLEQTHVVIGFEGRPVGAPDHDAAQVFAAAVGGGMSSRLFQEVREKRGLAYSIYGFHWDFIDTGLFGFYAGSADKDAAEVVAASLDCLAEAAHALDEAEIRRVKAQMKVSLVSAFEQPAARVHQLSRQMQVYGRPLSFDEMLARVDAVTVEDVRKTGAAMLRSPPAAAVIGAVGKVPGQAKIARALKGV